MHLDEQIQGGRHAVENKIIKISLWNNNEHIVCILMKNIIIYQMISESLLFFLLQQYWKINIKFEHSCTSPDFCSLMKCSRNWNAYIPHQLLSFMSMSFLAWVVRRQRHYLYHLQTQSLFHLWSWWSVYSADVDLEHSVDWWWVRIPYLKYRQLRHYFILQLCRLVSAWTFCYYI